LPDVPVLMNEFKRVLTPKGALVMTCVMSVAWKLIAFDPDFFKYDMVGYKNVATDFMNAHNKPMRQHENILVFSHGTTANRSPRQMNYFPQMQPGGAWKTFYKAGDRNKSHFGGKGRNYAQVDHWRERDGGRCPTTLIPQRTMVGNDNLHPNQKDLKLFEYLISTYTQPGMLVVDPYIGSGTTAVAARNLGRRFIGCDLSADYVAIANRRLSQPYTPSFMALIDAAQSPEPSATEAAA
jgi:site-specific DNA-methyltransferase (adenine-specific)